MRSKVLKFVIAMVLTFSSMPIFTIAAAELEDVTATATSEVSWCGNIPGYGTYPQRALKTITLTYPSKVKDNLDINSFVVTDNAYPEEKIEIKEVNTSGNTVTLTVYSGDTDAGILAAPGGNFRRLKSEFTITQNVDIYSTDDVKISNEGDTVTFNQDSITNIASDEFKDYIVASENSNNNIYVKYYLPENYNASKKYPMVVHHTGGGQHYRTDTPNAELFGKDNFGVELDIDLVPQTFSVDAKEDTIVVTIQCLASNKPENYSPGKDINQVVEYFINNFAVDSDRVYAIGNSQGGLDLSEAVALRPDLYTVYYPCNTSIVMGTKNIDTENPDTTDPIYQKCLEYCQAYVDNEVRIWFHVGRNDFTGAFLEDELPYPMLKDLYKQNGYSDEEIEELVKMTVYEDSDFKAVGSTYYHGATGLMCLNNEAVSWIYEQNKNTKQDVIVSPYTPKDREGNSLLNTTAFVYDATSKMNAKTESVTNTPVYVIYPDHKLNAQGATKLLQELGIVNHLDKYATKAYIVNPIEKAYSNADAKEWLSVLDTITVPNMKVIGIENGATFVNKEISQKDWPIAGIMTYGGEAGNTPKYSVPAYVANSDDTVVSQYVKGNNATKSSTSGTITTYSNPNNKYEIVATNSKKESLANAFSNAWETVLSKNGRIGNIGGTFYAMPVSLEREYQYTSFVISERLGMTRNVVEYDLNGNGENNLWYEYFPEGTLNAKKGTVPVVLMLHGNGNDPRTQYETSGWAQVAAENGIILVEAEHQGAVIGGYKYEAMSTDDSTTKPNDIITMINVIKEKYPQIDETRIYVEGLSKGSLNSISLGLAYTDVFAGVGAHSAGTFAAYVEALSTFVEENKGLNMPVYFTAGSKDSLYPVIEKGEDGSFLKALQLYQELNGMNVTQFEDLDADANPFFSMLLDNYGLIENEGLCNIYGGTLSNDLGAVLSLNSIEEWGHWNYEPSAQLMWDFFKQFRRVDGQLVMETETSTNPGNPSISETPIDDSTNNNNNNTKDDVDTGDTTNIGLYAAGLAISVGAIALIFKRKKETN